MSSRTRRLSNTEKEDIFTAFMEYDTHRDGYVTRQEALDVLCKKLGFPKHKAEQLFTTCDKTKNGRLSYKEFVEFYFKVRERMDELVAIYSEFDLNQDGSVSISEAERTLRRMGFQTHEIEYLLVTADANEDGRLQYEEFVKLWNTQ